MSNRRITRITFGPALEEVHVILDDGSELVGITQAEAEVQCESLATFQIKGMIHAGKGINGEPVPMTGAMESDL